MERFLLYASFLGVFVWLGNSSFQNVLLAARLLILYLVNQVEGVIMRAVDELQALQDERKVNLGYFYAWILEFELLHMVTH